jgi:hypothetical protein
MTQEYSPDPTPARADGDLPAAPTHFGPATTVTTKKHRPAPRGATLGSAPRPVRQRLPRRRPLAFFGDSRGLTFLGAVIVAAVIGTIGGVISAGTHSWVGTVFRICFIGGCVLAAILVHREDLLTVAFMPPLLFVATATAVGVAQAVRSSAAIVKKVEFQVGYAMSFGARTLWYATIATAVTVLVMFFVRRGHPAPRLSYTPSSFEPEPQSRSTIDPPAPYSPGLS